MLLMVISSFIAAMIGYYLKVWEFLNLAQVHDHGVLCRWATEYAGTCSREEVPDLAGSLVSSCHVRVWHVNVLKFICVKGGSKWTLFSRRKNRFTVNFLFNAPRCVTFFKRGVFNKDQAVVKMIIFSLSSNDVKNPLKSCFNTF